MWILERTLFNLLQLFFLLGTYVGVKWLNLMVGMCVAFWETTRLFSKVVVPFYISVSGVRGLIVALHPGQHLILRSVSSLLAILWMWRGFPGGSVVKNLPANAGDMRSSLGQENPLEEEMATYFSIIAGRILWTKEPGGLQSMGWQESEMT